MRSFLISMPTHSTPENVLVFLHGVGEAFIPIRDRERERLYSSEAGELVETPGLRNVFNHGVPMILGNPGKHVAHRFDDPKRAPFALPLFNDFLIIIPQMFLREDMADADSIGSMMDDACKFARSVVGNNPRIALMGFSRGGYAALRLAERTEVKVVVTMDAAPREEDMSTFLKTLNEQQKPLWALFADYKNCDHDFERRITNVHRDLQAFDVSLTGRIPGADKCKTLVPTHGTKGARHNQVCDIVSSAHVVYDWILRRV